MTVIADAGPLIHLSQVGSIDLLPRLYSRILIPDLVYQEVVQRGEGLAGSAEIANAAWVDVIPHESGAHLFRLLRAELDPGEAAAVWLALNKGRNGSFRTTAKLGELRKDWVSRSGEP